MVLVRFLGLEILVKMVLYMKELTMISSIDWKISRKMVVLYFFVIYLNLYLMVICVFRENRKVEVKLLMFFI